MVISFPILLLRLSLAILLGASIGFEREGHEHTAAGFRTNALVALGSALFTIISAYGFLSFLNIPHVQVDPSRISSYVVAGIGFLGAGSIFRSQDGDKVRGLTTAAAIWVVAAIGIACGAGLIFEAIGATILALVVLIGLRIIERNFLRQRAPHIQHIRIEATSVTGQFLSEVYNICAQPGLTIQKLGVRTGREIETVELSCQVANTASLVHTISELRALPGVQAVNADLRSAALAETS